MRCGSGDETDLDNQRYGQLRIIIIEGRSKFPLMLMGSSSIYLSRNRERDQLPISVSVEFLEETSSLSVRARSESENEYLRGDRAAKSVMSCEREDHL